MRQDIDHICGGNKVSVNPFLPLDLVALSNDAQIDILAPPTHLHLLQSVWKILDASQPRRRGD